MTDAEFTNLVVVITGAASGIGEATAARFAASGATLFLVDRAGGQLETAAAHLRERFDADVKTGIHDVSTVDGPAAAIAGALSAFSRVDVLVNNAGCALTGSVIDTSVEDWDLVFATNTRSVFLASKAVLPGMLERGRGVIVNTASEAGLVGFEAYAAYSASKAALVNLTKSMALDHARSGIRVNCVCPGSIETPLLEAYYQAAADPARAREQDEAEHPLGLGKASDVADAIVFLASPRSAYITGHALVVDGGYTAG